MTDPARSLGNPLNVRISLSKSVTRKVGNSEDWDKTIATVETDKPDGLDVVQALKQLSDSLDSFLGNGQISKPEREEKPQASAVSAPSIDLSAFKDAKTNSKNGKWIFADSQPGLASKLKIAGYSLDVEGGRLTLSKDEKFLTLWGSKK